MKKFSLTVINDQVISTSGAASASHEASIDSVASTNDIDGATSAVVASTRTRQRLTPEYDDKAISMLQDQTAIYECELERVLGDGRYAGTALDNGNCIVNLKKAVANGIELVTPQINRVHGLDKRRTGESIELYGAQGVLLVVTVGMANAIGLEVCRFASDVNHQSPISDDGLVVIDGNGRVDYLLEMPVDQWPVVYAVFPSRDSAGLVNIARAFEELNTNVKPWSTADFMQKRILSEGATSHEGWRMVNTLLKKGYLYQAACVVATLGSDRIKKNEINKSDAADVFKYYAFAKEIHAALVAQFGEGDDKVLKTKAFPMHVSMLWGKRRDAVAAEEATRQMVAFITQLPAEVVKQIINAKTTKENGVKTMDRDERRKQLLTDAFNQYFSISE